VYMSHGRECDGTKYLGTRDSEIVADLLWDRFKPDKCPSLVGKPKLVFIQACRGSNPDKGFNVCSTDACNAREKQEEEKYKLPEDADSLVMWASSSERSAYSTVQLSGSYESVFIHFLCKCLEKMAFYESLLDILVEVSRCVAVHYESNFGEESEHHRSKQMPQIHSTLIRKCCFKKKCGVHGTPV